MASSHRPARTVGARIDAADFGWHHPTREHPSVHDLNFTIAPGEKVLLLGASGAGKSTVLHAMGGLLHDEDGQSQLGQMSLNGQPSHEARGVAGLMQQDPESSVVLARVGDDVAFGPENLAVPRDEIWTRVAASLRAVGLHDLALNHPTHALSGGQKQRLGLAGILAMHSGALLLDEPTANLDPAGVIEVRDAVLAAQAATGATLVVIEHRVGVWAEHMDRVIVLGPEGITHDGAPDTVLAQAREELIAAGVWLPGYVPQVPERAENPGEVLLTARHLGITRQNPTRKQLKQRARALAAGDEPRLPLPAVASGIDVDVRAGEHLAILGDNGAGKSTLALTLAGLLAPTRGTLEATAALRADQQAESAPRLGPDIFSWKPAELASRVGLVFQEPEQQFLKATVREELEFGPRHLAKLRREPLDEAELAQRTEELMSRLRLGHLAEANPFTLSGGEKRRLSVATALATSPRVLILDEPTFGQDANTWRELVILIGQLLDEGIAVVSVTHDLDFVAALGGRRLTLHREKAGSLAAAGPASPAHETGGQR